MDTGNICTAVAKCRTKRLRFFLCRDREGHDFSLCRKMRNQNGFQTLDFALNVEEDA
jgi:hypothetical protein